MTNATQPGGARVFGALALGLVVGVGGMLAIARSPYAPHVFGTAGNRDVHGPRDVAAYIERLQDPRRLELLQVDRVVDSLAFAPDAMVADLGCGPGVFTLPFARAVPEGVVYGVDVEPRQLDALRARMRDENVDNVVPVLASYSDPHLPPGGVDCIFIADTYHHFENRVAYLRELKADLRPGGRIVLLEFKPGELPIGPPPERKVPRETVEAEFAAAGFVRTEAFDFHEYHDLDVWSVAAAAPDSAADTTTGS